MFQTNRPSVARTVSCPFPAWVPALLLLCAVALPTIAQNDETPELPEDAITAEAAWSSAQAQGVQAFVDFHLASFATDDAEAISNAREALLEPLNDLTATATFQSQYFRLLAQRLNDGLANYSVIGRVNAMMLARRVIDPNITQVLEAGMRDDNAGVRFGAAKTLGELMPNEGLNLNARDRQRLLQVLADAASAEPDAFVVGKLLPAISATGLDDVPSTLIAVFNARVLLHAADPALSYQPELGAVQELFISRLGQFTNAQRRQFLRAAQRYLHLISTQLEAGDIPDAQASTARALLTQFATILEELSRTLGLPGNLPPGVANRLAQDDFAGLIEVAAAWAERMTPPPLNFTEDDLSIAAPEAEGEAEEASAVAADG